MTRLLFVSIAKCGKDDKYIEEYMKVYHDVSMEKVDLKGNDKSE